MVKEQTKYQDDQRRKKMQENYEISDQKLKK